jgi:ectoine hydroxylase-related dioxygenase (phytanoyl-CoA dioxygenase family)
MLSEQQLLHYRTFGYVIIRNVFTPDEIRTMEKEFDATVERDGEIVPKANETNHQHMLILGDDSPFSAALTEDERLYGPATQVCGQDAVLWEWRAYRWFTFKGTEWHCNDGDATLGCYLYGLIYQWPVFAPVHADIGALRVIPGSHRPEFQWELSKADAAGLLDPIAEVGAVVCEAELGDVVAFDSRIFHGTAPYDKVRRTYDAIYLHFPETREEAAMTGAAFPPGGEQWVQWRANKPHSAFREKWEDQVKRIKEAQDRCGLRVERAADRPSAELVRA